MSLEKKIKLKGMSSNRYPGIQGGMGIGISLYELASSVGKEGWMGTIASVGIKEYVETRTGEKLSQIEAVEREIHDTKRDGGFCAINIMQAVPGSYQESLEGSVRGKANMIISGAGLPTQLPSEIKNYTGTNNHEINLVPIISSERALKILIKKWDKQGYRPDAVILEGPKAGGHLGWSYQQLKEAGDSFLKKYDLFDKLIEPTLDLCHNNPNDNGPIPLFVAGGIYTHEDILYAQSRGATGVQMGTRFAASKESGGNEIFKDIYLRTTLEDLAIGDEEWGSPCGYPFRYSKLSPIAKKPHLNNSFCICTSLKGASRNYTPRELTACPEKFVKPLNGPCQAYGEASYNAIVTCGTNIHRINQVNYPVSELIKELNGN